MKPFRWNLKKREQLGSLLVSDNSSIVLEYLDDLRECSAKVLARSDQRNLIFVGRSPENIFDYLSGIFQNTSWEDKIENLNISNRFKKIADIANELPESYKSLKQHCELLHLSPEQLISSEVGICFVDLVCEGNTFDRLFEFYDRWSMEEKVDVASVWKKLRFLGITSRKKNSPNTWRWYQHADWITNNRDLTAQSISIDQFFWSHMGDHQPKTIKSNPPERWNDESILSPPRSENQLQALRVAYEIYKFGLSDKLNFSKELAKLQEYKEPWLRTLSLEIKNF